MSAPTVTCVVPVHNGRRHLAEALDSVLGQTCPPHEVLVVDDGSTDDSTALVHTFGDRVRYLHSVSPGRGGRPKRRSLPCLG